MDEENKLPLKRVELSLSKFNEVAIPHHLDLLRQHKANIIKYTAEGAATRARHEQVHARRVTSQLRALLLEMDALRQQVRPAERRRFDTLTQRARDDTLRAITDYLESSPMLINRVSPDTGGVAASALSTESVGVVAHLDPEAVPLDDPDQIQLCVNEQELSIQEREELLRGWSSLNAEVMALHEVWHSAHVAALAQRQLVAHSAASVDVAADNVAVARGHLSSAEKLRGGAVSVGGACVGALLGGPVGLCAGAKLGALAAAAGSLVGYLGARALGARALGTRALATASTSASTEHTGPSDDLDRREEKNKLL